MTDLVTIAPGHQLAPAPAASARRMFDAGCPIAITSSYRSSARQAELRAAYLAGTGAFALPPGQSLHERGEAVDWKRAAAEWVRAHPEYGWRFTNPDEWWHTDYILALDRTLHTLTPITPEDDDMPLNAADIERIGSVVFAKVQELLRADDAKNLPVLVRLVKATPAAVLDAEIPAHAELQGATARKLGVAVRDTRIQTRRIQAALTEEK